MEPSSVVDEHDAYENGLIIDGVEQGLFADAAVRSGRKQHDVKPLAAQLEGRFPAPTNARWPWSQGRLPSRLPGVAAPNRARLLASVPPEVK